MNEEHSLLITHHSFINGVAKVKIKFLCLKGR